MAALFRTRREVERLEATLLELREALEQSWQRRRALEREVEEAKAEAAALRAAADEAPAALAAEREALRRQIDDLLAVKLRLADELRGALELVTDGAPGATAHAGAGGRVHGDLDHLVEGELQLVVEPLGDFDGIAALEHVLAAVAQVRDVHVRTADGRRAVYDLVLRAAGPLLRALDGRLPFDADATVDDGALLLRVRDAQ